MSDIEHLLKLRSDVNRLAANIRAEKLQVAPYEIRFNHECQDWPEYIIKRAELRSLEEAALS